MLVPSPSRAAALDHRMRERLGASLAYVFEAADGVLRLDGARRDAALGRIAAGPVSPLAFGRYYELVLALEAGDAEDARRVAEDLLARTLEDVEFRILDLADPGADPASACYERLFDSDPSTPLGLRSAPPEEATRFREQIRAGLDLLETGYPELAAEFRTLIRRVVLAVGPVDPQAIQFDGASSFMLWGAVLLNAGNRETRLSMAQVLAHESGHNLLFGMCTDRDLVENEDHELYRSPLRVDPRPMDGIVHATFVAARMFDTVQVLRASGVLTAPEVEEADRALESHRAAFARGMETVREHGRLTDLGRDLLAAAETRVAAG